MIEKKTNKLRECVITHCIRQAAKYNYKATSAYKRNIHTGWYCCFADFCYWVILLLHYFDYENYKYHWYKGTRVKTLQYLDNELRIQNFFDSLGR